MTALASYAILPAGQWQQTYQQIAASALCVQNWLLAANSVDYLAAANLPTPVQHFWPLSVEEQFYLVIPVIPVLALLLARRGSALGRARVLALALAVVAVVSFGYSLYAASVSPALAHFSTFTRA